MVTLLFVRTVLVFVPEVLDALLFSVKTVLAVDLVVVAVFLPETFASLTPELELFLLEFSFVTVFAAALLFLSDAIADTLDVFRLFALSPYITFEPVDLLCP